MFAAVAAAVMIIIAIPFFSMRLGSADAGSDPTNTTTRKAYDLLAKGFGPGYNGPLQLVAEVSTPAQKAAFLRTVEAVASTPGVVSHTPPAFIPGRDGHSAVAIADVFPKGSPQAASTADLLHTVRDKVVPRRGGQLRPARARRRPDGDLRRLRHGALRQAAAVHRRSSCCSASCC